MATWRSDDHELGLAGDRPRLVACSNPMELGIVYHLLILVEIDSEKGLGEPCQRRRKQDF
jgi:hypothetical protein